MTIGRILALDLGKKRIGLALSDELGVTAQGLETLQRTNIREDLARLAKLASDRNVTLILMGNPLHMSGREGRGTGHARDFGARLQAATDIRFNSGTNALPPSRRSGYCAKAASALKSAPKPWTGWPPSFYWKVTSIPANHEASLLLAVIILGGLAAQLGVLVAQPHLPRFSRSGNCRFSEGNQYPGHGGAAGASWRDPIFLAIPGGPGNRSC